MSGGVGLPASKALLKDFSVEDVDEIVQASEFAQPCLAMHWLEWKDIVHNVLFHTKRQHQELSFNSSPELPEGARITSANAHGASFWTQTARLNVVLPDGTKTAYFLKVWRLHRLNHKTDDH